MKALLFLSTMFVLTTPCTLSKNPLRFWIVLLSVLSAAVFLLLKFVGNLHVVLSLLGNVKIR